jgi:hypothetical protein
MIRGLTREVRTRCLDSSKDFRRWAREIGHAVAILILTISFSGLLGEFSFLKGPEAIYKGLFRFFRLTLLLCLPVYLLPPVLRMLGSFLRKKSEAFVKIKE